MIGLLAATDEATKGIEFDGAALVLAVVLLALNGFFVAAEFALVKVRASRLEERAAAGSKPARLAGHILDNLDSYLSACQLGITLASLILGALGEPAVSVLLIAAASGVGLPIAEDAGWVPVVSIALAFTVITVLHMTHMLTSTVQRTIPMLLRHMMIIAVTTTPLTLKKRLPLTNF